MDKYQPPFEISNKMLDLVGSIMEKIGQLNNYSDFNKIPILRRNNRIKSIHSSLAIEANSLTFNQVKDVINSTLLIVFVGVGVGLFLLIAILKIVFKRQLASLLMFFYMLILLFF